jgi:hypothetical protein
MTLPSATLATLRAVVARDGLRPTARAVALPLATVQRAHAGGGVSAGTAAALASALAPLAPRAEGAAA